MDTLRYYVGIRNNLWLVNNWIAHSINTEEFDDFDIEIDQIRSLWIVKQHIVSDTLL